MPTRSSLRTSCPSPVRPSSAASFPVTSVAKTSVTFKRFSLAAIGEYAKRHDENVDCSGVAWTHRPAIDKNRSRSNNMITTDGASAGLRGAWTP